MLKMVAIKDSSLTTCVFLTVFILSTDAQNGLSLQSNYTGSGLIQSPNYPSYYWNSLNYTWNLQASPKTGRISLEFQAFVTQSCCDFLSIFNGSTQVYRFSGPRATLGILLGSQATMVFTTDSYLGSTGFSISFTTFVGACGLNFYEKGVIQSPSYMPSYMTQCSWSLSALPLQNMRLIFLQFNVRTCCDVLRIYKTSNGLRTTVSALSGNVLPTSVMLGSSAEMQFFSSTGNQLSTFMICFYSTTSLTSAASAVQIGQCVKFLSDPWPELCNQTAVFNVTCTCTGCKYNYWALAISSLRVSMGESEPVCGFLENVQYSCVISASLWGSVVDVQNVSVLLAPVTLPTTTPSQPTGANTSGMLTTEQLRPSSYEKFIEILPSTLIGALLGAFLGPVLIGLSLAAWKGRWHLCLVGLLTSKRRDSPKAEVDENVVYQNQVSLTPSGLVLTDSHQRQINVGHMDGISNEAYNVEAPQFQSNDLYGGEEGYEEGKCGTLR